jgi:fructose/tagatose bisphosphate aldolase
MHGATGVSHEDIAESVRRGIRKVNYFSGFLVTAMDEVRDSSHGDRHRLRRVPTTARRTVEAGGPGTSRPLPGQRLNTVTWITLVDERSGH